MGDKGSLFCAECWAPRDHGVGHPCPCHHSRAFLTQACLLIPPQEPRWRPSPTGEETAAAFLPPVVKIALTIGKENKGAGLQPRRPRADPDPKARSSLKY